MSTSLGPSWNLRSSSSPRCVTAFLSKSDSSTITINSSNAASSSNPFEEDESSYSDNASSKSVVYSVTIGTERGSLHHRAYPATIEGGERRRHARDGYGAASAAYVDPENSINLQGAAKGSVSGIVVARHSVDSSGGGIPVEEAHEAAPVFLLLVDDNRGSSSSSSNPGAYAAHLVTLKHGAFGRLGAAPSADRLDSFEDAAPSHVRMGSRGSVGVGSIARFGADSNELQSTAKSTASVSLPRMSCATYHPNTGFVYASGMGVFSLSATNVKAVLAGMAAKDSVSGGRPGFAGKQYSSSASVSSRTRQQPHAHHATTAGRTVLPPPHALYLKAANSLPRPGARCSPTANSMTLACLGRVAIVAVSNSFYAVPACLDVGIASGGEGSAISVTGASNSLLAGLPTVAATKILAFAQSSQLHPVIAIDVMSPIDRNATAPINTDASHTNDDANDTAAVISKFLKPITSLVVLASGRECTSVEIVSTPDTRSISLLGKTNVGGSGANQIVTTDVKVLPPRHGLCTFPGPILAATTLPSNKGGGIRDDSIGASSRSGSSLTSGPLLALLTVDGLIHIRSPFCLSVPLSSIEVGTRPNDFFSVVALPKSGSGEEDRKVLATSYGGEARVVLCREESSQDFADRLLKMSTDAFGANGFPRIDLAEALGATFSATSYVGPEATAVKRVLLRQYLEAVLGIAEDIRFFLGTGGSGGSEGSSVSLFVSEESQEVGLEVVDTHLSGGQDLRANPSASESPALGPNALLTCTALLCLVCFQLQPPNANLANRASKACSSAMGTVRPRDRSISKAAMTVCDLVADRLLKEAAAASFSLLSSSASISISTNRPSQSIASMEFVEAAVWLLRSCGCHEKALHVLEERMNNPALRNASLSIGSGVSASSGGWSQIKFDSYIAAHLGELWASRDDPCCQLVLRSSATRDLISRNPNLGLSIFTTLHPRNEKEWKSMKQSDDPLYHPHYPYKVVELLKLALPQISKHEQYIGEISPIESPGSYVVGSAASGTLPLHTGRALAVTFLESAIGIATGRPSQNDDILVHEYSDNFDKRVADMHDELSYLLLEGVISERGDGGDGEDSPIGAIYRYKLRRLLSWENTRIRSERLLASLPASFLREHALLLGRLGRHEDAIKIFYSDLDSLELALEYCDIRHERQQAQIEEAKSKGNVGIESSSRECSYLPLVNVALNSDPDSDRGTAAAIQVLSLRRNSIDKSAALRLLPRNVPMSAVTRPFLIPALVENESHVRRLEVAEALLRSKYMRLKQKLTEAQLKSHASLHSVPALQKLHLGDPLHSSKAVKARPVHLASPNFPDVMLVKHFFPRHLVIQVQVINTSTSQDLQTLADVAFVIAESSDEALQPALEVPLKSLPPGATGSAWCVLTAIPQRLETCFLTCELRYTVLSVDAYSGAHVSFTAGMSANNVLGKTYVEELQDIEVRHAEGWG
ncbi:hypothetical protein HJC23_002176 [Cyclotella cryptica]|uniref:Coatomer gamma subunit appendage Ig-like subdomain domain-containing protein n=1 Tax=Cyclotella cryptica TaxID=29204 RepID=A0ABD3Q6D1_9STRA|eukprot:CCRYP_008191-RA/>CCRYP_008191-RA protein AED:0.07 eAED:0.07 QI:0/-1/0/1/-1/1/1/0/1449